MTIENFRIEISHQFLEDLRSRLKNTRWTNGRDSSDWKYGTSKEYLKDFIGYWIEESVSLDS